MKKQKNHLLFALIFLGTALFLYAVSGDYVEDRKGSVAVPDLILDHFGPYNLSFIFIWSIVIIIVISFIYSIVFQPKKFSKTLSMFSLFLIVRSGFVIFTHLRVPEDAVHVVFPNFLSFFQFSNDLFFSGHTGLPFLAFLFFRKDNIYVAYSMLALSVILGITVLLMHVHYSIDVFSAYFITYGIYVIGNKIFR